MSALYLVQPTQNSTSGAQTSPHTEAADLASAFSFYCGVSLLPWMASRFASWLAAGFEAAMIRSAIIRTSWAPRPSWRYLEAVMANASRAGTYTEAQFAAGRPRVSACQYHQREYTEAELDQVTAEMLEEAKRYRG